MKDVIRFREFIVNALTNDSLDGWEACCDRFHRGYSELSYKGILIMRCGFDPSDEISCYVYEPVSGTEYPVFSSRDVQNLTKFKIFDESETEALGKLVHFKLRAVLEHEDLALKTEHLAIFFKMVDAVSDK